MNHRRTASLCAALIAGASAAFAPHAAHAFGWPNANDEIFPPAASARASIDFDNHGFLIHGKRVFIVAGDLQYNRIPRALWRDRLLRIKRAGYNAIQTYVFWNWHEPHEGQFNFAGDHDLDAFLKMVKDLDMYAVVRVGPYVNADADSGGLPIWLRFRPGVIPMMDDAPFYKAVEPYWHKMLPIIAQNQITRNGCVVMVQLENENKRGGGTDLPDNYYKHYYQVAKNAGLIVPLFFSGLNHNDVPAGDVPFDTSKRHSPWYSTEFWTGWIAWYGVSPEKHIKVTRATWGIIAYGGAGYSHYVMAGGTDFGALNCDQDGASYDFGAPIGQAGDFRDDYYTLKRAALFATSFPKVLSASEAVAGGYGASLTNPALRLTGRRGKEGTILFIDNQAPTPVQTQIKTADGKLYPSAGPMTILPNEFVPIVSGYPVAPGVTLELAAERVVGIADRGSIKTIVVTGAPGEPAEMHFNTGKLLPKAANIAANNSTMLVKPGSVVLKFPIPAGKPASYIFKCGSQTIHILAEEADLADRTWFVPVGTTTHVITGPDYVGDISVEKGHVRLTGETRTLAAAKHYPMLDFGPTDVKPLAIVATHTAKAPVTAPKLSAWQVDAAVEQAQPKYDDAAWMASADPKPMGADDNDDAFAWYRTKIHVPKAGTYELFVADAGDWLTCFVNGKRLDSTSVETRFQAAVPRRLHLTLPAGDSTLALLAAHYGRNKLFDYYGPLDTIDVKGIGGAVSLNSTGSQSAAVTGLRWHPSATGEADAATLGAATADTTGAGWADYALNQDVFNGKAGFAWVRAALPSVDAPHHKLEFQSVDDNCIVYLNGTRVGDHQGVGVPFTINLDAAWKAGGPNNVAILVQNVGDAGGIFWALNVLGGDFDSGPPIQGWRMRGGETPPAAASPNWKSLKAGEAPGVPCWYTTTFNTVPPAAGDPHPILRANWNGLSRGSIWLNGHNLGRYPDRAPIDGLYLPECWLKAGQNTLQIFDEEGQSPAQMQIQVNPVESRTGITLAG